MTTFDFIPYFILGVGISLMVMWGGALAILWLKARRPAEEKRA